MILKKVHEVAEILNTSERNVYHKIRNGLIPVVRIGKMTRIRTIDIEKIIGMQLAQSYTTLPLQHYQSAGLDDL